MLTPAAGALLSLLAVTARADLDPATLSLRNEWERVNYQVAAEQRAEAFKPLVAQCESMTAESPSAEQLTWCGIVTSSYAGATGGLGALKYAKAARDALQAAIDQQADVLGGAALTSLGVLYAKVPSWPLGFGDDELAETLLTRGLEVNPDGLDANFFMAEFLAEQGKTAQARLHLERALAAPDRPGRAISDEGRRQEAQELLDGLNS